MSKAESKHKSHPSFYWLRKGHNAYSPNDVMVVSITYRIYSILLVFGMPHIHQRRIQVQVEELQASQIKYGHVHALCMLLADQ